MKLLRTYFLQRRQGRGSDPALTKAVVHHLPEVMFPRMCIVPNCGKLQNEISSRV
jgi:hypothetical protein